MVVAVCEGRGRVGRCSGVGVMLSVWSVWRCAGWGRVRHDRFVPDPDGPSREALAVLVWWQARQIAALAAENARLTAAQEELSARLARVEHLLSRNSANSSMPPSKDGGLGRSAPKEKNRGGGGGQKRPAGGQKGVPGSHLAFTDTPDERVDRFPEGVCACGTALAQAVDLGVVDRYQQTEVPLVTVTVTEYDQHAVACRCGKVHTATRPDGARPGPVGYGAEPGGLVRLPDGRAPRAGAPLRRAARGADRGGAVGRVRARPARPGRGGAGGGRPADPDADHPGRGGGDGRDPAACRPPAAPAGPEESREVPAGRGHRALHPVPAR